MAKEVDITNVLVQRIKQRDGTAMEYLYDHYSAALNGIISRTLHNEDLAQEVLQDTFLRIWDQIDKFDVERGTFFTWIYRIARNLALDKRKSRDFKSSEKSDDILEFVDIQDAGNHDEDYIGLSKIIADLGNTCKKLIQLNFFQGYSHKEISDNEEIALGTVKTRIRKCLNDLRKQLSKDFD